jgi:CubicO group peptidase (beta-lactamase class C family)
MRPKTLLVSLMALGLSGPAFAMDDATVAAALKQRLDGDRTGACLAVAVVEAGGVSRAYGCADGKAAPRVGAKTAFEIGSVSKTMVAALLAQEILAGGVSLDDPLAGWLPEGTRLPDFEGQPILLRHIVTHTSGLPALPPGVAITDPNNPYAAMTAKMLHAALGRVQLARAPGSAFEYSNFALMLLSDALARRTGKDFEVLLDQRLFAPLGMEGAYVDQRPDGISAARGHGPNTQPVPAWTFKPGMAGVGGVRATLDDMVAYVQGQLGDAPETLQPALDLSQQPVWTSGQPTMAMNWIIAPLNGRPVHVHEGGTGGFSSLVAFDREAGRGVVVLSDTALHSLGGLGSIGLHLLDPAVPVGPPRKTTPAPAALVDALVGDYELQGGMKLTLRRKGEALEIQAQGQPAFEMGHDSAGDFYPLAFDALLKPVKQPDGSQSFVWIQGGGAMAAQRTGARGETP